MVLRLAILVGLGCLAIAGPVAWDDSKCSQQCNGGQKYQYSPQTSYIYSYESSNELIADGASDLSTKLTATVKLTSVSKCEMVLEITDAKLQHGSIQDATSPFIEELKKHPLPFSWSDGKIDHVCPSPDDSNDVNNIKKGILSAMQNTMNILEYNAYENEVDVLGSCDTEYSVRSHVEEKYVIIKNKHLKTCTNHIKGQTLLLATPFESVSHQQHMPFLTGEHLSCTQNINHGIVESVTCEEEAAYKPLGDYGYVVEAKGHVKMEKISSEPATLAPYRSPKKESLVFMYSPHVHANDHLEEDAKKILTEICKATEKSVSKQFANLFHKFVYAIRGLSQESLEKIHQSLKTKELCASGKAMTIFKDSLRVASSGGSLGMLSKLMEHGELSKLDSYLFLTLLPFSSYISDESIAALVPLLTKDNANKQALLGISSMAYKYCSSHDDCEEKQAIKDVSSSLKQFLGDKCQSTTHEEEKKIITALKAFGNLGYVGKSADSILECATLSTNNIAVRISAVEAFRRSPCTDDNTLKVLELYKNRNEDDEVRVAALLTLSRCASVSVISNVVESYDTETSNQVKVFTWSYLQNLVHSMDPVKSRLQRYVSTQAIKAPSSTDITKFSRNFQSSLFSDLLNIGQEVEANIVHSRDSFHARSGNIDYKINFFGNQIDVFEGGFRIEDIEHILEKLFGPQGLMPNLKLEDVLAHLPGKRTKRSESYSSKLEALSERYGYTRGKHPHGSMYFRVMGHELGWLEVNKDLLNKVENFDIKALIESIQSINDVDVTKNLLFLDVAALFPSITGRAYKLSLNDSINVGFKADGKIDLRQTNLPYPQANIDGSFQPSLIADESASFTIHSEDFEPGVKVQSTITTGLDFIGKFEMKNGRFLHTKLSRKHEKEEIFGLKRKLYYINHNGEVEMPKPESYNLKHCSKYINNLIGVKYCASLSFPHFYNSDGKLKIPLVRAMEASFVVEQTEKMDGYELLIELPDPEKSDEKHVKFLLDTPNSQINRKMSLDFLWKRKSSTEQTAKLNIHNPFYSVDVDADYQKKDDGFKVHMKGVGDKKRRYELLLDVGVDVKGARLVEYSPKISVSLPNVRKLEMSGTIVFARGRKQQVQISLQSNSLDSPVIIKGNIVKEGESIDLDHEWKTHKELNITAFNQIHRYHSNIGNRPGKGLYLDLGHHYEPDGRSYESITANAKLENVELRDHLNFNFESTVLIADHQDLNNKLTWDFSFKPLHHIKSDIAFRYGENFKDNSHLIRVVHKHAFHGDFDTLQHMDFENKLGVTISCLDVDASAAFSTVWNFGDMPRFFIEAGVKTTTEREVSIKYDYKHTSKNPVKFKSEGHLRYYAYKLTYHGEAEEKAPHEYHGKSRIETGSGKHINSNYVYKIKSTDDHFHQELDATTNFPGGPLKKKILLDYTKDNAHFKAEIDTGSGTPSTLELKLKKVGENEAKFNTPFVDGNVLVGRQVAFDTIQADIQVKGKLDRRVLVSGRITPGDISTLDLDVSWDADKDKEKKISVKAKSHKETEDGISKHMISSSIVYIGSINVDITGKVSTDLLRGPHYFRADLSGNMEPYGLEITHDIKNGNVDTVAKFLRTNVEKIRLNIKSKYTLSWEKVEFEAGALTTSPYKTFDGKELFFRIMGDANGSNGASKVFITEYRIKPASIIGYVGKIDYERKKGWPGQIKSDLLVTVHSRPIYQGSANIEYGNGKYSSRISYTPVSKKKINFISTFEHSAKFAAFHQSLAASFRYIQKVDINAVADLRNIEDAKIHSNADFNDHNLYDVNTTLKFRNVFDFDGQAVILSKITPSFHLFSKAQSANQATKYEMNLDVDGVNLITGTGEIKKRKKGFNGDIVFNYKEKEFLALVINQVQSNKAERNYTIKVNTPWRSYSSNININKEKNDIAFYQTKFCREGNELCIAIDVQHKHSEDINEYQIAYKRGDLSFNVERIRVNKKDLQRFHTVIYKEDKRYGYDLSLGKEGNGYMSSVGLIIPSREILTKGVIHFSLNKPRAKLSLSLDAKNHPDRKLTTDWRFNHLVDDKAPVLDLTLSHPIFEKPIELHITGDYDNTANKYFTSEMSIDYSSNSEDKIIGKFFLSRSNDGTKGDLGLNIYHQDDQHLDFVITANRTNDENQHYFGGFWNWKDENSADESAYAVFQLLKKEKKMLFDYKRPRLTYRLEAEVASPDSVLSENREVELSSTYNGVTTKAKILADLKNWCQKLIIYNSEGTETRTIKACQNDRSRQMFTAVINSLDEDGNMAFDFEIKIIRKSFNKLGYLIRFTPEFIGNTMYKLTALGDELTAAGVGSIPIAESPRYQKMKSAFVTKVWKPTVDFIVPEMKLYVTDLLNDVGYLVSTLRNYYQTLPTVHVNLKKVMIVAATVIEEMWSNVANYYKNYFKTAIEYAEKISSQIKDKCNDLNQCQSLVKAFRQAGWKGIWQEIKNYVLSIPELIENYINQPGVDLKSYYNKAMEHVKTALEPLGKCRCGEILVKVVQMAYHAVDPHVQNFLDYYPTYAQHMKEKIFRNQYITKLIKIGKEEYFKAKAYVIEYIKKIDFESLRSQMMHEFEDYLFKISPPSLKNQIKVNAFDMEKGVIDFDINVQNLHSSVIYHRMNSIIGDMLTAVENFDTQRCWSKIVVVVKRIADLNFIPPYDAHAMIVGNHHFVTYDNMFYDFAGECTYLLSRDFEDGNFTFAYKSKEADKASAIIALIKDISVEINSSDNIVSVGDNLVELPYITDDFTISRSDHAITLDSKYGVHVKCNLMHEICSFSINGYYFGKTAGLLGTYNYEPSDDFKRPKGQIANTPTNHAKSWELKKNCKSNNLLSETRIDEKSDYYELCKSNFENKTSPLSACFYEVDPKDFFQLCLRHSAQAGDKTKALCDVATAYITECENHYIELNLPSKCLTCRSPDGSILQHGDRKKFENLTKKSADVVFIVEDLDCNKAMVNDIGNLARAIDKELQNEGFKENMFGVVGFGGAVGNSQIYTVKGKTFFNSRDINAIKERFAMEQKKSDHTKALEAMMLAVKYPFRSDSSKSFVLLSCTPCKYDYRSLMYPVVQQILLERGITLHVVNNAEISVRKKKEKDIIGVDPDTVYHTRDVNQKELKGEPALRSQVILPKDLCIALSQDVAGSYFVQPSSKAPSAEIKNWRSVFARKFLKSTQRSECRWCDCTATRDHVPSIVCQPCDIRRPRLPFSVCKSCLPKYGEAFLSYLFQIVKL